VTIEGADHVVNMRQPEEFNRVLLAFLADAI
jgi:pimeloyl-ACP methyl ester carboxylesterase